MDRTKNLIWVDLEMTGLRPESDVILEIATIITDSQLNVLEHGPEIIIHQPDSVLANMNDHVKKMHTNSGLLDAVKSSKVSIKNAEQQTMACILKYCDENTALLAGNSIWQDRNFLYRYMPSIVDHCYYRVLDVTAIKEVVARWYPHHPHAEFKKKDTHRALADIEESIAELRHLKKHFFIKK
ncbi:oligoribonuclease [bacterium]|nr:oligoribonuclease [bacterium]